MFRCETCNNSYHYQEDCDDHMDYRHHWPQCETCDREFDTQRGCDQHMDRREHWAPKPCETCHATFRTRGAARRHMDAEDHYSQFCVPCELSFKDQNELRVHRNSRIHRGITINCPFCRKDYTTVSGLAVHLETAACPRAPPNLDREFIHRMIRRQDPHGVITMKHLTLGESTEGTYYVTENAWNGAAWECYLCHRGFARAQDLMQHLNSPAHKQNLYHCMKKACGKQFKTLAALFNHLESESCGAMRFEQVRAHWDKVVNVRRLIKG